MLISLSALATKKKNIFYLKYLKEYKGVAICESCLFDLPPDQSDFPYKRKAPQVSGYKWRTNKIN